jgi:hypothetical protein
MNKLSKNRFLPICKGIVSVSDAESTITLGELRSSRITPFLMKF